MKFLFAFVLVLFLAAFITWSIVASYENPFVSDKCPPASADPFTDVKTIKI